MGTQHAHRSRKEQNAQCHSAQGTGLNTDYDFNLAKIIFGLVQPKFILGLLNNRRYTQVKLDLRFLRPLNYWLIKMTRP